MLKLNDWVHMYYSINIEIMSVTLYDTPVFLIRFIWLNLRNPVYRQQDFHCNFQQKFHWHIIIINDFFHLYFNQTSMLAQSSQNHEMKTS